MFLYTHRPASEQILVHSTVLVFRFIATLYISTGERPFIDIVQDRRYWLVHLISIPSLFSAGVILISSGFIYRLFGTPNSEDYFNSSTTSLLNDRFTLYLSL